MTDTIFKEINV